MHKSRFTNLFYGPWEDVTPEDKPKTAMKLVCAGPEEKVVGLHIIGRDADEMLQGKRLTNLIFMVLKLFLINLIKILLISGRQ